MPPHPPLSRASIAAQIALADIACMYRPAVLPWRVCAFGDLQLPLACHADHDSRHDYGIRAISTLHVAPETDLFKYRHEWKP